MNHRFTSNWKLDLLEDFGITEDIYSFAVKTHNNQVLKMNTSYILPEDEIATRQPGISLQLGTNSSIVEYKYGTSFTLDFNSAVVLHKELIFYMNNDIYTIELID